MRPSLSTERATNMIQAWKAPHILKGMLTYVPVLNAWRSRRATTGGSNSSRYCYAVWLRHLTLLGQYGFNPNGAAVGELGPGDSLGTGFAALLSGARRYVGLDIVPYAVKADVQCMLYDLVRLYESREPIPDHHEFPRMRPRLASYDFLYDSSRSAMPAGESHQARIRSPLGRGRPWCKRRLPRPLDVCLGARARLLGPDLFTGSSSVCR